MNPSRPTTVLVSAISLMAGVNAQQAEAAVIIPTSYSYSLNPNHHTATYHDDSLTKLSDDVSPSGNFNSSYAAWLSSGSGSVITFTFDQAYDFSTVQLFTYNNGSWAKYAQNLTVTIGGTSTNFGTLTADEQVLDVSGLDSGSTVQITFTNNAETWFSEIDFAGTAVPEPGSLALIGLGGLCMLRRRR